MSTANLTPYPQSRWQPSVPRVSLALVGFAAGIAAALYTYDRKPSLWLSLVVFTLAADTLGRRLADVLEQPRKLQRLFYVALLPAASAAILYATYTLWGTMWLAAILAVPAGAVVQALVGWLVVPTVAREELPPARIHWELHRGQPQELELTQKGWRHVEHRTPTHEHERSGCDARRDAATPKLAKTATKQAPDAPNRRRDRPSAQDSEIRSRKGDFDDNDQGRRI